MGCLVAGFHSRTVPSASALARSSPSGLNATPFTPPPDAVSAGRGAPIACLVAGFHSRTVPSASALARSSPSGLNATPFTPPPDAGIDGQRSAYLLAGGRVP